MAFKRSVLTSWVFRPGTLISLSMILLASATCIVVLLYPPSESVVRLIYVFHMLISVLLVFFLGLTLRRKGPAWEVCSLILVISLFILPLIHKWQTAFFNGSMMGGLLPWSDASGYYEGAHRLMEGDYLTEFATRRPIFIGFLAVLLWTTRNNLQLSLILLAVFNGLAVFLAAREIQRGWNAFIAATFIIICYWYYVEHAGAVTTENLGLCISLLGIAFLIRGSERTNLAEISSGLFVLTIALSIRAGAFFILPALLLWFLLMYTKVFGWKGLATVSLAILIAMTSNVIIQKSIGNPKGVLFSNYSHTLYGLASGNTGWAQVYEDYPGVKEDEIFDLAIDKIRREPGLFIQGMAGAFKDYFTVERGAFSFFRLVNDKKVGNYSLWVLTWAGIAAVLWGPKKASSWMILFAFAGILFSTFLLPPIDADFMRVYATTIPFTALLAASGLRIPEILFQKLGLSLPASPSEWKTDSWLMPYSVVLLLVCLLSPVIVKFIQNPVSSRISLGCAPNEVEILFRMGNHSSVNILNDSDVSESYVPNVRASVFQKSMSNWTWFYDFITQEFMNLEPGYSISIGGFQRISPQSSDNIQIGYLLIKGQPLSAGDHQICVTPARDENLKGSFFYYTSASTNKQVSLASQSHLPFTNQIQWFYGLIFVATALSFFDFWWLSPARKIFVLGNMFLIITGLLIYLHRTSIYPLSWTTEMLKTVNAVPMGGHGYNLDLELDWMDRRFLGSSTSIVYENGTPLKRPDQGQSEIKKRGKGRYSIENGELFFSASDNSNPQSNGKTYEVYGPTPLPPFYEYASYLSVFVGIFFLGKHWLPPLLKLKGSNLDIESGI